VQPGSFWSLRGKEEGLGEVSSLRRQGAPLGNFCNFSIKVTYFSDKNLLRDTSIASTILSFLYSKRFGKQSKRTTNKVQDL